MPTEADQHSRRARFAPQRCLQQAAPLVRLAGLSLMLALATPLADLVVATTSMTAATHGWGLVTRAEAKRAKPSAKSAAKAREKQRKIEAALAKARSRNKAADSKPAAAPAGAAATPVTTLPNATAAKLPTLQEMRAAVLAAPAAALERVGRHIIVGYHNAGQIVPLIERGGIGGVFVTARNATGKTKDKLAAEIAHFRELAAKAVQSRFWVSTDQEGGGVARL